MSSDTTRRRGGAPARAPRTAGDSVQQGDLFGGGAPESSRNQLPVGSTPAAPAQPPPSPREPASAGRASGKLKTGAEWTLGGAPEAAEPAKASASPVPVKAVDSAPVLPAVLAAPAVSTLQPVDAPRPAVATTPVVLSVSGLTRRIKGTLETTFPRVLVKGEVSGFRGPHVKGHLYFALKDEEACIDVKIWASTAQRLKFRLREGMELVLEGTVDVYARQGRYSLIAHRAEPVGEGALALAFQQLKERLTAEGLMGDKRLRAPRPLPFWPRRIGVVTSRTGAALRDFLRVLEQRNPRACVVLCDARVQGEGAAADVCRALSRLSRCDVDVIVVTRGGGSLEDLWTFNEESVARAIHACRVPVISAIGHEVDFTIADFVADHRAPTPSAAAALVMPVLADLELQLRTCAVRLRKAMERQILTDRQRLSQVRQKLSDPRRMLTQKRLHLHAMTEALVRATRQTVRAERETHRALAQRLARLRPEARLRENRLLLTRLRERLVEAGHAAAMRQRAALTDKSRRLARHTPQKPIAQARAKLSALGARLTQAERQRLFAARQRFLEAAAGLHAMSPLQVMSRGYAVVFRNEDGKLVRAIEDVRMGDGLRIQVAAPGARSLADCGELRATVTGISGCGDAGAGGGGAAPDGAMPEADTNGTGPLS